MAAAAAAAEDDDYNAYMFKLKFGLKIADVKNLYRMESAQMKKNRNVFEPDPDWFVKMEEEGDVSVYSVKKDAAYARGIKIKGTVIYRETEASHDVRQPMSFKLPDDMMRDIASTGFEEIAPELMCTKSTQYYILSMLLNIKKKQGDVHVVAVSAKEFKQAMSASPIDVSFAETGYVKKFDNVEFNIGSKRPYSSQPPWVVTIDKNIANAMYVATQCISALSCGGDVSEIDAEMNFRLETFTLSCSTANVKVVFDIENAREHEHLQTHFFKIPISLFLDNNKTKNGKTKTKIYYIGKGVFVFRCAFSDIGTLDYILDTHKEFKYVDNRRRVRGVKRKIDEPSCSGRDDDAAEEKQIMITEYQQIVDSEDDENGQCSSGSSIVLSSDDEDDEDEDLHIKKK